MSSPTDNPPTSAPDDLDELSAQIVSQVLALLPTLIDTVGREEGLQMTIHVPNGEPLEVDRIGVDSALSPSDYFNDKMRDIFQLDSSPNGLQSKRADSRAVDEPTASPTGGTQQDVKPLSLLDNKKNATSNGVWKALESTIKLVFFELRARGLSKQGNISESMFEQFGDMEDLNRSVDCRSRAVELTSNGNTHKPRRLSKLGAVYLRRYHRLGELLDIDKAIECFGQAVKLTPEGHPNRLGWVKNLGSAYQSRFDRLSRTSDIHEIIAYRGLAVELTPQNHADHASLLESLGRSHLCRFLCLDNLSDVDKAVTCQARAVKLTPIGHPDRPNYLNNLGITYRRRFERLGKLADAMDAVSCQIQAVQLTPDGHPDKPCWLLNLGNSYQARFLRLGELSDVEKAITCQSQAVALTPDDSPTRSGRLMGLGTAYIRRFERLGELSDINKAVSLLSLAVQLTSDSDACALNNLGTAYMCRFEHFGSLPDIKNAVHYLTLAVNLTPDGRPEKSSWLGNLGDSYVRLFQRLGNIADIDQALTYQLQAVQMTPDGHACKPMLLNNVAISFMCRFGRLRTVLDARKAVTCQSRAVKLTPDGHAQKPSFLNGLANSYQALFKCLGDRSLINEAIACRIRAVQLTPDGHANKPARLNSLGTSYECQFESLGDVSDISKAIACQIQALHLTPDGHADKAPCLSSLAGSYRCRFERLGDPADIDEAIVYQIQAVQLTLNVHSSVPDRFNHLGSSYMHRFELKGMLSDAKAACTSFQKAAQAAVTNPGLQLSSACQWSNSCRLIGSSPKWAYQRSMELASQLVWLGLTVNERYQLVAKVGDVARESAAWAISVQEYDLAVEWVEEGRSIVWTQILRLRNPFGDLYVVDPVLAQRLKDVAFQLERAGSRGGPKVSLQSTPLDLEKDPQNHRRLAMEWEQLLERARKIPRFQNSFLPRKADELKFAAADGLIVMINTHQTRCDALIIRSETHVITHVPLANFSLEKSANAHVLLESLVGHRSDRAGGFKRSRAPPKPENMFKPMLAALWLDVVKPVLDSLGYTHKQPADALPHVTWCTTGALAFLPLHAAGLYDGEQPNAFDLVVSSYAPTLSTLLDSKSLIPCSASGVLAVGQMNTPGLSSLPYTVQELSAVQERAHGAPYLQLDGKNATVDVVLNAMEEHSWVHLACHAKQDPENPTSSAFCLHDGNLTLETITKRAFKNKGLAFLSACQTATGDSKLPDEALHLAAGMLMAGYPSVIATMWSICDADGPNVAETVYSELIKDGKMDHRGAARALHKAVGRLREKVGEGSFKQWVPFIHLGV